MRSSFVMDQQVCQTAAPRANTMPESPPTACENASVHKTVRRMLGIGLLAGLRVRGVAQASLSGPRPAPPGSPSRSRSRRSRRSTSSPWVDAAESGACPAHHPVKAKLASGIFHVPGGANYTRTQADRCYLSAEAAEADGLRPSKN